MSPVKALKSLVAEAKPSRAMRACFWVSTTILVLIWALYAIKILPLAWSGEPLALHYSVLVGIDKIGPWWWTLSGPALALASYAVDWLIALRLWHRKRPELAITVGVFVSSLSALFLAGLVMMILLNVGV